MPELIRLIPYLFLSKTKEEFELLMNILLMEWIFSEGEIKK